MSSDITHHMHIGIGEFRDNPTELWYSHSWALSIRTTSGQFAHYAPGEPSSLQTLLHSYATKRCQTTTIRHTGRVWFVGRDYRTKSADAISVHVMEIEESSKLSQ
jgi:hypothetical protein